MTEIILSLAALLLGLFCLIYSVRHSRELRSSRPGGPWSALKRRHGVYTAMLVALVIDALASAAEKAGLKWGCRRAFSAFSARSTSHCRLPCSSFSSPTRRIS